MRRASGCPVATAGSSESGSEPETYRSTLSLGATVFPKYWLLAEEVQLDNNKHADRAIAIPICSAVQRDSFISRLRPTAWTSKESYGGKVTCDNRLSRNGRIRIRFLAISVASRD